MMAEREVIRSVFKDKYFDLRIYRWMVEEVSLLKLIFGIGYLICFPLCIWTPIPIVLLFFTSFILVVIGGIDHIIIGSRLRLILRILWDDYKIEVSQQELVETCRDLIK